jgi:transposase
MDVIIGIDPHKASHTAVAVGHGEVELARLQVRSGRNQLGRLLAWAEPFASRRWAVEGAEGLGFLLAQQLVAADQDVVDVPATLAARTRLLGSGRSNKNDPNDALSVALTALRHRDLRAVVPAGSCELFRLLSKRHIDLSNQRTRLVSRLHALAVELSPGGIAKVLNSTDAAKFLATVTPTDPVAQLRAELLAELANDIAGIEAQITQSRRRIRDAVSASGTSLTDIFGVGPIIAAMLSATAARCPALPTGTATPPTTAPPQPSSPLAAARCTASPSEATGPSTTPCTSPPSSSSATATATAAPTTSDASPRARPAKKPSAPSSDSSPTSSTGTSWTTPSPEPEGPGGHQDTTHQPA